MEKEWEIKTFSDFVWTEILCLLLYGALVWSLVWLYMAENNWGFLIFAIVCVYYTIQKVILLFRSVHYRQHHAMYFKIVGQILHYSLPEMGQGQIDVRQLDLLQHQIDNVLIIPLRGGSGSLKLVRQHFQAPFMHQDYHDWCKTLLTDLEKAQWDNQQPFHSFLNKEIPS